MMGLKNVQGVEDPTWRLSGCDTFSLKRIWTPDIWSTTLGPQLIGPSGQTVLNQFGTNGQMVRRGSWGPEVWGSNGFGSKSVAALDLPAR